MPDFGPGDLDAPSERKRFAAAGDIQDGKLRAGLTAVHNVGDEAGNIVDVYELNSMLQMASAGGK